MYNRRTWIIAGLVLLVVFGVYWMVRPRPIAIETAEVALERFTHMVEEDGRTRIRNRYTVSAPISGLMPRLILHVGDPVQAGQTLISITPNIAPLLDVRMRKELEERVGAAEAALEEAASLNERTKVDLVQARTNLARTAKLQKSGAATAAQLDRDTFAVQAAEREAHAAEQRWHAAEHALRQAKAAVRRSGDSSSNEHFPVLSPIDGRVLKVIQESEAAVPLGSPILELGDPKDLEVAVDILTSDAASIRPGARAVLERWGGEPLEGRVRRVEPSGFTKISALGVEEQRVWVILDITSQPEKWTGLGDGYRVDVKISVEEIDEAITMPIGALFRRGGNWHVFIIEGDRAKLRTVDVARRSGRLAAISAGVQAGEVVIVYPPTQLTDGSAVERLR
jgi:HlyD family secretion protein